jgi:hypothetical protein
MPTKCPAATLQLQLGAKTFAHTTGGAASRQLSLAWLESILLIPEVQTHDRNLGLTPLLAAALFETVSFSFLSLRLDLFHFRGQAGEPAEFGNQGSRFAAPVLQAPGEKDTCTELMTLFLGTGQRTGKVQFSY